MCVCVCAGWCIIKLDISFVTILLLYHIVQLILYSSNIFCWFFSFFLIFFVPFQFFCWSNPRLGLAYAAAIYLSRIYLFTKSYLFALRFHVYPYHINRSISLISFSFHSHAPVFVFSFFPLSLWLCSYSVIGFGFGFGFGFGLCVRVRVCVKWTLCVPFRIILN